MSTSGLFGAPSKIYDLQKVIRCVWEHAARTGRKKKRAVQQRQQQQQQWEEKKTHTQRE